MKNYPAEFYSKEKSIVALYGYSCALSLMGLGLVNYYQNKEILPSAAIIVGGGIAAWGYLKTSGILY